MHDHVNYFNIQTFSNYNIVDWGNFGEWSWVSLSARELKRAGVGSFIETYQGSISNLFSICNSRTDWSIMLAAAKNVIEKRDESLNGISELVMDSTLAIYSAAGKGINFAFAAEISGLFSSIIAVDVSSQKQGKYMECSGVQVLSLHEFTRTSCQTAGLVILNKNHEQFARNRLDSTKLILTLPQL